VEPSLAKEGRGGSKRTPSLAKEGRGGSKNLTWWIEKPHYFQTKKARLLEKETSLKAWIQVSFTGLPLIQN
jgi:hypothetical protein